MSAAEQPLATSLDEWRAAWTAVGETPHGSPEWEEATALAEEAQWRFRRALRESKADLSQISRLVLAAVTELEKLEAERDAAAPESARAKAVSARIRSVAERLATLAEAQERTGKPVPPGTQSIATFERDGA